MKIESAVDIARYAIFQKIRIMTDGGIHHNYPG
jgi:hypothetical protein